MGRDVGKIFPPAALHRDHWIMYALVCEKEISHMGKINGNLDLVCEKTTNNPSLYRQGITTTVPARCVSAHASFFFKIDRQKTQCLLIALNKMQLLKKIRLYVEVIFFKMCEMWKDASMDA